VKQSDSNPLRKALAQSQHGDPHPDADVLTALGEGSLLQDERQRVLAHVAACGECREVLSVAAAAALDSVEDLQPVVVTRRSDQPRRAWLPWASVAAGLLIVCSAVLVYQQRLVFPKNATVAMKEPAQLPMSSLQPTPPSVEQKVTSAKTANSPAKDRSQSTLGFRSVAAKDEITRDKIDLAKNSDLTQLSSYRANAGVSQIEKPGAPVLKAAQAPALSAFANTTTERAMSAASATAAARPHWRINNLGQAERAYGEGAWQAVLPLEQSKMRVVSVLDSEVWIGGENSRLYRSTDNGATWTLIVLPERDGREHAIAHIRFQSVWVGTVESNDGTVWITMDGGNNWK
jgi:hypothetical protein